jgi:hypothetical protein
MKIILDILNGQIKEYAESNVQIEKEREEEAIVRIENILTKVKQDSSVPQRTLSGTGQQNTPSSTPMSLSLSSY